VLRVAGCPLACLLEWIEREEDHVVTVKEFQIGKYICLFKMMLSNKKYMN